MILSDFDLSSAINGKRLLIEPFAEELVRENGIDLRLDNEVGRHKVLGDEFIMDPTDQSSIDQAFTIEKDLKEIVLAPKEQVLLTTYEKIALPDDLMGFVEIRSTWARHG